MEITMKELKVRLSAALNMLKGFCYNGRLCDGWKQVDDNRIEFRYADNRRIVRISLDGISEIGTCCIYDKKNGFNKPYPNVVVNE